MQDSLTFTQSALKVLEKLNSRGYDAYIVGGAVRDAILGIPLSDIDVATNATTEQMKVVFSGDKVFETGVKHGTLTVISDGEKFEITTFRNDGDYSDARHPDSVKFISDVKGDLARRDFTINAMAYSPSTGVIDLFGGKEDLEKGVIKAVGDPEKRFDEDGLRILRAVRFASKLGFEIEKNTLDGMKKCIANLFTISAERVFVELTGILCGAHRYFALHEYSFFVFAAVPEIQPEYGCDQMNRAHCYDVYEHTLHALEVCREVTPVIAWALLLHDSGKPFSIVYGKDCQRHFPDHWSVSRDIAEKVLSRLKAPNEFRREVKFLAFYHDDYFYGGKPTMKRFLRDYGEKFMLDLCVVKEADWLAHSGFGVEKYRKFFNEFRDDLNYVLASGECYTIGDLAVDGEDVKELGFSGKKVGEILSDVLDKVIDYELENEKTELIGYIKEKWSED